MIIIVVSLGATVFAFASGGFTGFGNSFESMFSNSSSKIAENVVIQQVTFTNTHNPSTSGFTLFVLNAGISPTTIQTIYLQNVTVNTFVKQFTSSSLPASVPPLPVSINSGILQTIKVFGMVPDHGFVYGITIVTVLGNTVTYNAKYN